MLDTAAIEKLLGELDAHPTRILLTDKQRTVTAWYNSPLGYLCLAEDPDGEILTAGRLAAYLRDGAIAPVVHGRDGMPRATVTTATPAADRHFGDVLSLTGPRLDLR